MQNSLNDRFAESLGFEIVEVSRHYAKVRAKASACSLNGADVVHGGYLYSLADFAFALASNTGEKLALNASSSISYLKPCGVDTEVFATVRLFAEHGRSGVFNAEISDAEGNVYAVAQMRASYKFKA